MTEETVAKKVKSRQARDTVELMSCFIAYSG
jgi:hypothetical protein